MRRPSESPRAMKLTWLATKFTGRFSKTVGGAFAARLWFTPWAVDADERSRRRHARWLGNARPLRIPFRGKTLSGFVAGDGPTLLLVHGWGERAATLGALVEPLVARGFRVVGVDLPAHGDSPGRRTDIPEEADALRTVVENVGPVEAVIAHSMGGAVTTYALAQGLPVDRVVLIAPAVRLGNALETFAVQLGIPHRAKEGLRKYIEGRFGETVWEDIAADHLAPSMEVPALIVHDTDDDQVSWKDGELLAQLWPSARFVKTAGLGHVRLLGDERVLIEIDDFLLRAPVFAAS